MEAPERGALMLVRFVAAALIAWAVVDVALYVLICQHNGSPIKPVPCVIKSLPFLIGFVMLVKAKFLAHWISDKLDL